MKPDKPYIIAEVGSNWYRPPFEGMALAFRHIDEAWMCGVDAVKFQLFNDKDLYGLSSSLGNPYFLPEVWLTHLETYATLRGLDFLCSAFSPEGVKKVDEFVKVHKVASSEAEDLHLLDAVIATKKPFIVSIAGMDLSDTKRLAIYIKEHAIQESYLLNCVAKYPAKTEDYQLRDFRFLFKGISDHTLSNEIAVLSIGAGAFIFEKHFDALKDVATKDVIESPDSEVSIGPIALKQYVKSIHKAFAAMNQRRTAPKDDKLLALRWKRRLKIIKEVKSFDVLEYGVNFGSYRSLEDDTHAVSAYFAKDFNGKRIKKEMKPQEGIWYDDVE